MSSPSATVAGKTEDRLAEANMNAAAAAAAVAATPAAPSEPAATETGGTGVVNVGISSANTAAVNAAANSASHVTGQAQARPAIPSAPQQMTAEQRAIAAQQYAVQMQRHAAAQQQYAQAAQAHAVRCAQQQPTRGQLPGNYPTPGHDAAAVYCVAMPPVSEAPELPSADPNHICPVCRDAFGDEQSLSRHAARSHARDNPQRGEPLQCPVADCTQTLANNQNLRRHIAVRHSGERTRQVAPKLAGSAVTKPGASPGEERKPKSAKVFVCSLCPNGATFRWKGNLKRHHQLVHLQVKNFKCMLCSEMFGTKSNREVHMIVHQKAGEVVMPVMQQQHSMSSIPVNGAPMVHHPPIALNGMPGSTMGVGQQQQVFMPTNHINVQVGTPTQQQVQMPLGQNAAVVHHPPLAPAENHR